jgi:hypothetical protein
MLGSFENGNEPSNSIKGGEFIISFSRTLLHGVM